MTYVKIGGVLVEAEIRGRMRDPDWNGRESRAITLTMDYEQAKALFVDGVSWSILDQPPAYQDRETGEMVEQEAREYDNSDFEVAGPITDNRDGTLTVKMGKPTDREIMAVLLGGDL